MEGESELQSKLRVFHERKKLAILEDAIAPASSGRSLTADAVPAWVAEAVELFWKIDTEPEAVVLDEVEPPELAEWTEEQLARYGIGRNCYVATHLSIRPWIGCVQKPGWTQLLRGAVPEPIVVLAEDISVVVEFHELEYVHAVIAATA